MVIVDCSKHSLSGGGALSVSHSNYAPYGFSIEYLDENNAFTCIAMDREAFCELIKTMIDVLKN